MKDMRIIKVAGVNVAVEACCLNCHNFYSCSSVGKDDKDKVKACLPEHKLWKGDHE